MRSCSAKVGLFVTAIALTLALAVPALAAKSVSWKTSTNRTITVRKGTAVKLVWSDSQPHNVRGYTGVYGRGHIWSHRFTRSATLYCDLHAGMRLRINVR